MVYLVDTNILLRSVDAASPLHSAAVEAVKQLVLQGEDVCVTTQNLIEFWSVATCLREHNGFGLTPAEAGSAIQGLRSRFQLLEDTPTILGHWNHLVVSLSIRSKQAHDARLVAVMMAHGVTHLLTFNVADFKNYSGITVVDPNTLINKGTK